MIFFTCVADWQLTSVGIVHAYTGSILVAKIFSVVASINFTLTYNTTQ